MPRPHEDRRPHSVGRGIPVDPREPGFDARSILVQGLVDKTELTKRAMTEIRKPATGCMSLVQNASAELSELW